MHNFTRVIQVEKVGQTDQITSEPCNSNQSLPTDQVSSL